MNNFLGNLINRHQERGVNQEMSSIVEPRPKSRFETEPVPATALDNKSDYGYGLSLKTQTDSDTGPILSKNCSESRTVTTTGKPSSIGTQTLAQESINRSTIQPDPDERISDFNEQIEALTLKLGKKFSTREMPINAPENKNYQQAQDEPVSPNTERQVKSHNLSITDELNQRIQMILQRLNNQPADQAVDQNVFESQFPPTLSEEDYRTPIGPEHSPLLSETTSEFVRSERKEKKQSTQRQLEPHQSGLLQPPSWLTEMQADLNNRWQGINSQLESPEPIVNVTIGRVEVRAVQTSSETQPRPKKKPSGVMSLDDYLKQREHKGRA